VLCDNELADFVDRGCPLVLGGPLPHVMAAKAVALSEASAPSFEHYAAAVVENARALAEALIAGGVPVVTGGTDNHLVLLDVRQFGLNGRQAEAALRAAGITLNRNVVPDDTNGAWYTSGLRLGTPAVTTLGMRADEMREVGDVIAAVLHATSSGVVASGPNRGKPSRVQFRLDEATADAARSRVADLLERHPLYPEIEL
jgi:glycine hydroxymethyltransferase